MNYLLATGVLFVASGAYAADVVQKPNILVILTDDQGYADVGFNGSRDIPTPHLDRLAREGMRCTNGYVSHPYCSPSRAGLLTGRCQLRFGHESNPTYDPRSRVEGLPLSETLLPEYLADAGYATGWIGKWHLGAAPEFRPENRGFRETFGFYGGGHQYLNWKPDINHEYRSPITRNGKEVEVKEHLTVAFGHEAANFIRRHDSQPWFLYLAFNAPHSPHQPTAERLKRFEHIANPDRRAYCAQISLLDDAVGEALDALRASGQSGRTLVFFLSDNGGPTYWQADNAPWRGGKGLLYEGGVHVPFIVSWPGRLPAGKDYTPMVSALDIFATSLALAGVAPDQKKRDGVNLLPFLDGTAAGVPHDRLFWRREEGGQWAMRKGSMKLVDRTIDWQLDKSYPGTIIPKRSQELFDLGSDLHEDHDLSSAQPEQLRRMVEELDAWCAEGASLAFPGDSADLLPTMPPNPHPTQRTQKPGTKASQPTTATKPGR